MALTRLFRTAERGLSDGRAQLRDEFIHVGGVSPEGIRRRSTRRIENGSAHRRTCGILITLTRVKVMGATVHRAGGSAMTDHTSTATIRDVLPRDGLQAETPLPAATRADLAVALADAGLAHVEATSFVSAKAVPSMAGAVDVFGRLPKRDTTWWALVPNAQGALAALDAGVTSITVTVSASSGYSEKNVRRSTSAAIAGLARLQ